MQRDEIIITLESLGSRLERLFLQLENRHLESPAPDKAEHFAALTGLRAIAASLVFFHHFPVESPTLIKRLMLESHIGVNIFFVLSGFLIAHRYGQKVELTASWAKPYFIARIARIYPLFFVLTSISLIWNIAHKAEVPSLPYLITCFTLTVGFFEDHGNIILQAWTLTVEESFYCLAPLILVYQAHQKKLWPLAALIFSSGIILSAVVQDAAWNTDGLLGSYQFTMLYTFFGRSLEFFVGIKLAAVWKDQCLDNFRIKLTYLGITGILACLCLLAAFQDKADEIGLYSPVGLIIALGLLPFMIAILIRGLLSETTPVSACLGNRWMTLLGASSYAFYLIHMGPIQKGLDLLLKPIGDLSRPFVAWILMFALLQLVSVLIFVYVEEPARRYVRRIGSSNP